MIEKFKEIMPITEKAAFIAWNAEVIGDVEIYENSSVWYSAVVRGDEAKVTIGKNSNIQDCASVHVAYDIPCNIGNNVTIGHGAIIHGCSIDDNCIIGMGAILLNNAKISKNTIVAAGSVIPEGKEFPEGVLLMGSPAKIKRELSEKEKQQITENAKEYIELAEETRKSN